MNEASIAALREAALREAVNATNGHRPEPERVVAMARHFAAFLDPVNNKAPPTVAETMQAAQAEMVAALKKRVTRKR